jgi:hypothetical protein
MYYQNLVEANEHAKELLGKYGISASRSKVSACRNAFNVKIERKLSKLAKNNRMDSGIQQNRKCELSLVFV